MEPRTVDASRFLDQHASWILRLATVLSPSAADAEDLAQDVIIRAIKHLSRDERTSNPRAYLRRMVINENIRRSRQRLEMFDVPVDHGQFEPAYANIEDRLEAGRLLRSLPPRQAGAIALRYLEDCGYKEIAATLGCRENTARSLVKRGLDLLRRDVHVAHTIEKEK